MAEEHAASKSTYRPQGYGMSAGLLRARRPFFLPNLLTGVAIASFSVGVWAYSISAVKQDVFDDVDEQAKALNATIVDSITSNDTGVSLSAAIKEPSKWDVPISHILDQPLFNQTRGLLATTIGNNYPWLFEPIHKTLVWGAPPVDRIGRIQDRTENLWQQ